jgi:hypothetical protein
LLNVEELNNKIKNIFENEITGINIYVLMKNNELKKLNLIDDQEMENDLIKGFKESFHQKLKELEKIDKYSEADKIENHIYLYDLANKPIQMEKMLEDFSSQEIETTTDFLNIEGFLILIGSEIQKIVIYKKYYAINLLKKDKFLFMNINDRITKANSEVLKFDFNFEFFLLENNIYIPNIDKLEKICKIYDILKKEASNGIKKIEEINILENTSVLLEELEKSSFAKKVIKACGENGILDNINKEKLLKYVKDNPHYSIKVNTQNKLILNTKKAIQNFIKILNEEILISKLTNTEYEVHSKNKFTE